MENQIYKIATNKVILESLTDYFQFGKAHIGTYEYDLNEQQGNRYTNQVQIFISITELLEICRKLESGELRKAWYNAKKSGENKTFFEWMGGTPADKLAQYGHPRADGKSLSRVGKLMTGTKADFLFVSMSGAGETNATGLVVPKFGNTPENKVVVPLSFEQVSEMFLTTRIHYQSWLNAKYLTAAMNGEINFGGNSISNNNDTSHTNNDTNTNTNNNYKSTNKSQIATTTNAVADAYGVKVSVAQTDTDDDDYPF